VDRGFRQAWNGAAQPFVPNLIRMRKRKVRSIARPHPGPPILFS
jgi:hypothetical protein